MQEPTTNLKKEDRKVEKIDEEEENKLPIDKEGIQESSQPSMEVSIHAIGVHSNRTITLTGIRGNKQFSILVDGGSTHSFLNEKTALKLKCEVV